MECGLSIELGVVVFLGGGGGGGNLFSKTSWRGQSRFRSKVCFYLLARKWEVLTKTGNNNCRYDMHNLLVGYFLGQEIETSPGV